MTGWIDREGRWNPEPDPRHTYPNARDCEHGYQRGHCPYCELAECEQRLAQAEATDIFAVIEETQEIRRRFAILENTLVEKEKVQRITEEELEKAEKVVEAAKPFKTCDRWSIPQWPEMVAVNKRLMGELGAALAEWEGK